ncbi:MAG: PRC-barrel domain-containing protein, partial [Rhodospirillaceae bacterium]|nr:PRC-barrel domain-containing protein [Rhodospirillaceae bacterium]
GQGDRVTADMTKEQLEAMPEYKRPENVSGTVYSYDEAVRDNQFLAEGGVAQTTDIAPAAGTEQTDIDNETTVTAAGLRASEVVGADVKNATGDNIGEISEVILQQDGSVNGVIVDVGGFLGVGERPVLVNWKDLQFAGIEGDVAVTTTLNKDQLATFPEFKASR